MLGGYWDSVAIFVGINVLMGMSFYIPMAAGLISLGQGGFMAIGAYTSAVLTKEGFSLALRFACRCWPCGARRSHCRCAGAARARHLPDDPDPRLR